MWIIIYNLFIFYFFYRFYFFLFIFTARGKKNDITYISRNIFQNLYGCYKTD